jgi:hypothetical protein
MYLTALPYGMGATAPSPRLIGRSLSSISSVRNTLQVHELLQYLIHPREVRIEDFITAHGLDAAVLWCRLDLRMGLFRFTVFC